VVIAGHNGAGKTTIYRERIAGALTANLATHINPDEVEQAITLDLGEHNLTKDEFEIRAAEEAARLRQQYLTRRPASASRPCSPTPVQDKVAVHGMKLVAAVIWWCSFAVGLESMEKSKARVAIRHAKGGHNVPRGQDRGVVTSACC
jgi:predicted ABC-type ATPase